MKQTTIALIAVFACSPAPATVPAKSGGHDELARPAPSTAWPAGLVPCPKDAQPGEGCAKAPAGHADSRGAAPANEIDSTIWNVPVGSDDPVRGPPNALVTVVEFSDFQCPFCKHEAPVMKQLLADYPEDVRLVWKDCPLPMHAYAEAAAELARAAREAQGDAGFWKVHDAIYEASGEIGEPVLRSIAKELGLKWERVSADMRAARYGNPIRAGSALADRVDVRATPTVYVNGRKLTGARPYAELRALVDDERDKARKAIAAGAPAPEGPAASRNKFYESVIFHGKQVEPPTDLAPP